MTSEMRGKPCSFCEFSSSRYGCGSEQDNEAELREQVQNLRSQLMKMTGRAADVSFTELQELKRTLLDARQIVLVKEKQQREREEEEKQDNRVVPSRPPLLDNAARMSRLERVFESRKSESLQRKRDRLLVSVERMNGRSLDGMTSHELRDLYREINRAVLGVVVQMQAPIGVGIVSSPVGKVGNSQNRR